MNRFEEIVTWEFLFEVECYDGEEGAYPEKMQEAGILLSDAVETAGSDC